MYNVHALVEVKRLGRLLVGGGALVVSMRTLEWGHRVTPGCDYRGVVDTFVAKPLRVERRLFREAYPEPFPWLCTGLPVAVRSSRRRRRQRCDHRPFRLGVGTAGREL